MNATVKLILRESYTNKDGFHPVCLRLTLNRKSKYYSLGVFISKEDLQKNKFLVKDSTLNSNIINIQLTDSISRANHILLNFARFNLPPTFVEFDKLYKGNFSNKSFKTFAEQWINGNKDLSAETVRTYKSQLTKLGRFVPIEELTFQELNNLDFIQKYKNYMLDKLKNKTNTIYKSLAFLRTMIKVAKRNSILSSNVFDNIKLRKVPGRREFLSYHELVELEKLYRSKKLDEKQKNTLKYFLFSCYTGLRYTDVKNLKHKDISDHQSLNPNTNQLEKWKVVQLEMHKTKLNVDVPLVEKAKTLVSFKDHEPNHHIFRVISNQKTNKYLREIMVIAKIERWKKISYHCSRHTFAINMVQQGMPYRFVSKILGHTNSKTTEIYTNPNRDILIQEMQKNNYFN